MFSCLCSADAPAGHYYIRTYCSFVAPTQSVCGTFSACWMHFLNRILQVESNICVDLSHRALRHTTVYYYCNLPEDHYHSIGRIHIFLFQHWDLFYSRASVYPCSSDYCPSVSHVQTDIGAVPAVVFHSTGFLRLRTRTISDLSVPSAVYRQNLQSLLPASSTLHYPVAPRVPRASHRIASHHNGA